MLYLIHRKGKVTTKVKRCKSMMTTEEMVMYDMMVELGVATSEELNLARNLVSGSWKEVLTQVLDIRTGYKSIEQMLEEEEEE